MTLTWWEEKAQAECNRFNDACEYAIELGTAMGKSGESQNPYTLDHLNWYVDPEFGYVSPQGIQMFQDKFSEGYAIGRQRLLEK